MGLLCTVLKGNPGVVQSGCEIFFKKKDLDPPSPPMTFRALLLLCCDVSVPVVVDVDINKLSTTD